MRDERELDDVQEALAEEARAAADKRAAAEAIATMNAQYAVLCEKGKSLIISERVDPVLKRRVLDRSSVNDLKLWLLTKSINVRNGKDERVTKPLADYWLTHPTRRSYSQLVFDPEQQHPADVFNLWKGFHVEPKKGSWSAFRDHLFEVGAAGNAEIFTYIERWLARLVQKPGHPAETAIVLRGGQGAGKGLIARSIGHLFGQHFVHVQRVHHLAGHFNAHLEDGIFVFADEAVWGGDRQNEGALKALITEPTLAIERKGRDAYIVRNVIHLMLATNNDWAVPAGLDDRRFCIVDVPSTYIGKQDYFARIVDQLEHGGYEAMLYDLLNVDLAGFRPSPAPTTDAGLRQKILGMRPIERWWFDVLKSGDVLPGLGWPKEVNKVALHDEYCKALDKTGDKKKATQTELSMLLRRYVPRVVVVRHQRYTGDKVRPQYWLLPSLEACRSHFERLLKQSVNWDDVGGEL